MSDTINAIKIDIDFNHKPACKNCCHCSRYEKDANAPFIYNCGYAGKIEFQVDEDDACQKWEEI